LEAERRPQADLPDFRTQYARLPRASRRFGTGQVACTKPPRHEAELKVFAGEWVAVSASAQTLLESLRCARLTQVPRHNGAGRHRSATRARGRSPAPTACRPRSAADAGAPPAARWR